MHLVWQRGACLSFASRWWYLAVNDGDAAHPNPLIIRHPIPNQALRMRFEYSKCHLVQVFNYRPSQSSEPSGAILEPCLPYEAVSDLVHISGQISSWKSAIGIFLEPSRHSEASSRAFVVFGTEMALGAVFDHNVYEASSEADAGNPRAESPIVFDAFLPVISIALEVQITLLEVSFASRRQTESLLHGETIHYTYTRSSITCQIFHI